MGEGKYSGNDNKECEAALSEFHDEWYLRYRGPEEKTKHHLIGLQRKGPGGALIFSFRKGRAYS